MKEVVKFRCTAAEKTKLNEAAKARGLTLSDWLRQVFTRAAAR